MAVTSISNSAKVEFLQGAHCFNATLSGLTATNTSSTAVTGLTTTAGISVGMAVTGANVAANTFVSAIASLTALTLSVATTGSATSLTFTGDVMKLLLIKAGPGRTFDGTQTNIGTPGSGSPTATNVGTDEASGTGYTTGGVTLVNTTPALSTSTATITFSTVTWTTATISTVAAIIYNSSARLGGAVPLTGRTIEVLDLGGTQTVTAGTLTLTFPTNDASNAVLRIS